MNKANQNILENKFNPLIRALLIVVIVLVTLGSYKLYKFIWPAPYVAQSEGFQIVFPSNPTTDKLKTQQKNGIAVSGTIYSDDNLTKDTDYAVYATNYAKVNFSSYTRSAKLGTLESELETIAKNDQASLSDGQTITFKGDVATKATLTPSYPSEPKTYVLTFLHGNKLYILLGAGISSKQFDHFTQRFNFTT